MTKSLAERSNYVGTGGNVWEQESISIHMWHATDVGSFGCKSNMAAVRCIQPIAMVHLLWEIVMIFRPDPVHWDKKERREKETLSLALEKTFCATCSLHFGLQNWTCLQYTKFCNGQRCLVSQLSQLVQLKAPRWLSQTPSFCIENIVLTKRLYGTACQSHPLCSHHL